MQTVQTGKWIAIALGAALGISSEVGAAESHPTRVYWGDQHIHTGWSVDAGGFGCTLSPEDALRFARGEEVKSSHGLPAKLARPLDWGVVTDHSDAAGVIFEIRDGNPELMKNPTIAKWRALMLEGKGSVAAREMITAQATKTLPDEVKDPKLATTIWRRNTEIMEKYNEPGKFTAFIGYEWTPNVEGGDNLHRNVIYRDGKALADQATPMTTFDSENPEDLWKWMDAWEKKTGGRMLAIPHNGNLSNGRMFALTTFLGDPLTREWAETRAKREPLYEITQIKGDGETHPSLSPTDEFAGFERWDTGNLIGTPKKPGMLETEYARRALANGLALADQLGANPFKFGIAAGTDTHTGLSTAAENDFFGKHSGVEPSATRWEHVVTGSGENLVQGWRMSASGWTGIWARENTRESLFDAMGRKETYGTTGSRITVRFFAGYGFEPADAQSKTLAEVGYSKGVPMGGDLASPPAGKSPSFLIAAQKDPMGGNLDRIQVIALRIGSDGKPQENVYDVAWSDPGKRKPGADGKLPPVGSTVDVANASYTNSIGAPELSTVWTDPAFDPARRAAYYVRVIEIPTPRWTAFDAKRYGVKMPPEVPMTLQERAYTSPIWYTPAKQAVGADRMRRSGEIAGRHPPMGVRNTE